MDFRTPDKSRYQGHRLADPPAEPGPEKLGAAPKKRRLSQPKTTSNNWKKIIAGLVLAAIVVWLVYGYITTKHQLEQAKSPSAAGLSQTQQLINKVGRLVDLPQGETPTIASVNDASKLKNQAFFANAKNGDKVLIYSKAGKAVLYRPSTDRVIEYSTVNLGSSPAQ